MPRVRLGISDRQQAIEKDLAEYANGARFLNMKQVGEYLGTSNRKTLAEWLADVPAFHRGNKDTWHVMDIARKIERSTY